MNRQSIQSHYNTLRERLVEINGMIHYLNAIIRGHKKEIEKKLGKDSGYIVGSRLGMHNPLDGMTSISPELYFMKPETLDVRTAEIYRLVSNLKCAQAYEAFETFLIDLSVAVIHEKKGYDIFENKNNLDLSDLAILREEFKKKFKKNAEKLAQLRKILKGFEIIEKTNANRFDYRTWFDLFSDVRHAITHQYSNLSVARLNKLDGLRKQILETHFGVVLNDPKAKTVVIDTSSMGMENVKRMNEYAFLISHYAMACFS